MSSKNRQLHDNVTVAVCGRPLVPAISNTHLTYMDVFTFILGRDDLFPPIMVANRLKHQLHTIGFYKTPHVDFNSFYQFPFIDKSVKVSIDHLTQGCGNVCNTAGEPILKQPNQISPSRPSLKIILSDLKPCVMLIWWLLCQQLH